MSDDEVVAGKDAIYQGDYNFFLIKQIRYS